MPYEPPSEILDKYADVLVNYALGGGEGIKPGEVVLLRLPESAKPLLGPLWRAVTEAGGHFLTEYQPEGLDREHLDRASHEQIGRVPERYFQGLVDEIDHLVRILGDHDPDELEGVDPAKLMSRGKIQKAFWEIRHPKEHRGELTWTIGLYGTEGMAKKAGLTTEEYWGQIRRACFLDEADPVAEWRRVSGEIAATKGKLNELEISRIHIEGEDADLWVGIGPGRSWEGGSGANIPSFEIFTSPDWRGTEGWIRFDQPLSYFGPTMEGIELKFKAGEVVEAKAQRNGELLERMLETDKGARRLGEISLTDRRHSRIDHYMAETLYDENFGGEWGNTHLALGMALKATYPGDTLKADEAEWERLGYNNSQIHVDIVSASRRRVTAELADGSERVIYEDGEFTV